MNALRNAMSVDVEDWFQVQAFANIIPRDSWDARERRVEANTHRVLDLFAAADIRATFFALGWVAERHPMLIRRIVSEGHELASHGYGHQQVHAIGETAFRTDIRRARAILQDASGVPVIGYRAPTFSISARHTPWAHAVLAEEGYRYSSSVFPVRHDLYGDPDAPRRPHWPRPDGVAEIPLTTVRAFGRSLPCAGGGWFRLLPYGLTRVGLGRVNSVEGQPGVFYFHPWEIDPGQPRAKGARWLSRFRHYIGLPRMEARLARLLREFRWAPMNEVFSAAIAARPRELA